MHCRTYLASVRVGGRSARYCGILGTIGSIVNAQGRWPMTTPRVLKMGLGCAWGIKEERGRRQISRMKGADSCGLGVAVQSCHVSGAGSKDTGGLMTSCKVKVHTGPSVQPDMVTGIRRSVQVKLAILQYDIMIRNQGAQ